MTSQSLTPAPSRLARIGFSLSSRSNSGSVRLHKNKEEGADEEWYIPYNGPYEAPREDPRKRSERDSWGDIVLEKAPDDDAALTAVGRRRHHANPAVGDVRNRVVWKSGSAAGDSDRREGTRARSHSNVSSSTADHSQSSLRRGSTNSSAHRPPVASYINLDASGGVGESPMPQNRGPQEGSSTRRSSLFSFGGQVRKASSLSRKLSRPPRPSPRGIGYTAGTNTGTHRRSSSTGSSLSQGVQPIQPRRSNTVPQDPARPLATDDEDLYNSYYATLVDASKHDHSVQAHTPSTESSFHKTHPYAQVTDKSAVHKPDLPHLTFSDVLLPPKTSTSADAAHPSAPPAFSGPRTLKNSASTPDLRKASNLPLSRSRRLPPKPNGFRDRWLSPETWCDALLFPRPRLRIREEGEVDFVGSGRIVSPPGSPLPREFALTGLEPQSKGKGVASRVLVHSRSLADLAEGSTPEAGPSSIPNSPATSPAEGHLAPPLVSPPTLRPPRPRSFAHDDMSLVPSVAR
jgi:serine/arginine repetitive matrix protein 2